MGIDSAPQPLSTNRSASPPILIFALVVVLGLAACQEEAPTGCPTYEVGAVEGFLLASGQGASAPIGARALEGSSRGHVVQSTVSDSTGWYRLDLPTGLYRLEVDPTNATVYSSDMRDTIRVTPRVHRLDLIRGRAEIGLGMPDELMGRTCTLRLSWSRYDRATADERVQDGVLEFDFPALQPGAYSMELYVIGSGVRFFLPSTTNPDQAAHLDVDTDRVATYELDFTDTYASITGRITGSWQEALGGSMRIEVYSADSLRIGDSRCLADGSFTCDVFVPQEVRLRSECTGVEQWIGGDSYGTARVFDVQPGDRITDINMVESGIQVWLEGPGHLTSHRPTPLIRDEEGRSIVPQRYLENPLSICNLRPGRYFLRVDGHCEDQTWAPQWYDGSETFEGATPIELGAGELRHLVIDLVEGGRIEGRVLGPDGEPPPDAYVGLFDSEGDPLCSPWDQWRRWRDGVFIVTGLADGDYYLAARDGGDEPWWYPGTSSLPEATLITIEGHAAVSGVSWRLPEPGKEATP